MPRPGRFTPEKEARYPFYRRLSGSQGRSGRERKISLPPGFDPRTVQPVGSRYTDCAIPAPLRSTRRDIKKGSSWSKESNFIRNDGSQRCVHAKRTFEIKCSKMLHLKEV